MRLIDADALLNDPNFLTVRRVDEFDEIGESVSYLAVPVEYIEKAPTLDYAPVRRGEWKYFKTSEKTVHITDWLQCSVCGRMWDRPEGIKYNYCPSCGAKMDGRWRADATY